MAERSDAHFDDKPEADRAHPSPHAAAPRLKGVVRCVHLGFTPKASTCRRSATGLDGERQLPIVEFDVFAIDWFQ